MDWIGDHLTHLIQEGQKALGHEIVVMSDAKEDEVDNGSNDWEEEQDNRPILLVATPSIFRHGSILSLCQTHKPCDIPLPPSYLLYPMSPPNGASLQKHHFDPDLIHLLPGQLTHRRYIVLSTPHHTPRGMSVKSDTLANIILSSKEDESTWQSPKLHKSMEQACARYLQRHIQ